MISGQKVLLGYKMKHLQFGQKENPGLRLVFLHGYGASAQDLSDFRHLSLPTTSHWIFLEGPLELALGGRAWFPLKLHLSSFPQPLSPRGIYESPEVLAYLEKHVREIQNFIAPFSPENLVLGGFSQGAVMALNVALRMKTPPLALVFLSGALFPDKLLEGQKQSFCQGGRVFQAHGKNDPLLSFSEAKKVEDFLVDLSWKGHFLPFEGGHEIPPLVLSQMLDFLKNQLPN